MIVNDLYLLWPSVSPHEADPPLVIDPDAVLSGSVAFERLEPVSWRQPQILQGVSGSHLAQLPQRRRLDPRIDRRSAFTTPQSFGDLVPERSDHETSI